MRILFFVALSLIGVLCQAQDTVTFVRKGTGKEYKLSEPDFCMVKMKGNVIYPGIYTMHHDSVLSFKTVNKKMDWSAYMVAATTISKNPNLTSKEKQAEMQQLIYTDTTRFKYSNIKRIKIMRTDKQAKMFHKIGWVSIGVTLGYAIYVANRVIKNKTTSPVHSYIPFGIYGIGVVFVIKGNRKIIKTKHWKLKGD